MSRLPSPASPAGGGGARFTPRERVRAAYRRRPAVFAALALIAVGSIAGLTSFAVRVNALRALRATGSSWSFPSRVFSDAVILEPGRAWPESYLLAELAARGYVETSSATPQPGSYRRGVSSWVVTLRGFLDGPDPEGGGGPESVRLDFTNGLLSRVERLGGLAGAIAPDLYHPPRLEPVLVSYLLAPDGVRRSYVQLERVPEIVQEAVVAAEDRRFYGHFGLDVRATTRALFTNIKSGEVREGGSTITQQLARGLFLGSERTLVRKFAEIPISIGLEVLLDKREILEMYLNMVYWGQADPGGVAGIAEAARWYFDVPVESLDVADAALLAAMIPAPNATSPFEEPEVARRKRNMVLVTLAKLEKIRPAEAARLATRPLGVKRGPTLTERFPSYSGHLKDVLSDELHRNAAESRGLSIFTTMDLAWQQAAESGLDAGLDRIGGAQLEGAFIALEPGTSAIRAIVGGRHVGPGEFNRATHARRQSGSAIKPIVYAAALMDPVAGLTPASTFPDERRVFGKGRWAWKPRNEGDSYHASVTLACALAYSLNVATANLVEAIGPWTVARVAERFGLKGMKPVMSIGLGANEVSLLDLTAAYAAFGNGGMRVEPTAFRAVVDPRGRRLLQREPRAETAVPPAIAAVMTGLLQNVVSYGVARGLPQYGIDRPVAGKTGTTNEYQDGWFIGYTPHIVAGAWVGYDQPRSLGRAAARTALPVWGWIVQRLIGSFPRTPFISDVEVEYHDIEPWTGYLGEGGRCPVMRVPFIAGTAPTVYCGWESDTLYRQYGLDSLFFADTSFTFDEPPADSSALWSPVPAPPPGPAPAPDDTGWVDVEPDTLRDRP